MLDRARVKKLRVRYQQIAERAMKQWKETGQERYLWDRDRNEEMAEVLSIAEATLGLMEDAGMGVEWCDDDE